MLAALVVLGMAVLLLATGLSVAAGRTGAAVDRQVATDQELTEVNEQVLAALLDAETGQRGYLLTGEDRYLAPYDTAVVVLPGLLGL